MVSGRGGFVAAAGQKPEGKEEACPHSAQAAASRGRRAVSAVRSSRGE